MPDSNEENGTGSRARTYDLRFWRPPLYQLSYARTRVSAQALPKSFRARCKELSDALSDPLPEIRIGDDQPVPADLDFSPA
jgi:hypothetical protein